MKIIGFILIAAGFLGAALVSVLRVESVAWSMYLPILAVGVAGLVLFRRSHHASSSDLERVRDDIGTLGDALHRIREGLDELSRDRDALPAHEARFEIDRRFRDDLQAFAEARHSMKHAFGLQAYADIMSAFAAGERYLNRVWTASADGYVDEVRTYIAKADRQFAEADDAFREQRQAATRTG
ncbi:MAG: hypothetical protein R3323_09750 [Wenzhouxiangellaceae bacterium]|nr:hypothetical protein [Wenzhouxiangellaceae bacterium]